MIKGYRRCWNNRHTELRRLLAEPGQLDEVRRCFLSLHAQIHSSRLDPSESWSYEDEIFSKLTSETARSISKKEGHSIVWLFWHIARIEDVTMNLLIAGDRQILQRDNWQEKLHIRFADTGNAMAESDVAALSATIDIPALRAYRLAVGRSTQDLVPRLGAEELIKKVQPARLEGIRQEGAVVEAASDLLSYWGRRNVAGLLLMPATRHNFVHLNEAHRIKNKIR
jgi:hypothetical protein